METLKMMGLIKREATKNKIRDLLRTQVREKMIEASLKRKGKYQKK